MSSDTVLNVVGISSAVLSIIGSSLIVASYAIWADLRTTTRKLLVYLSLCDFVTALFNLIGLLSSQSSKQDSTELCIAQSFFNTWSNMSSFFWTVAIAIFLYFCIVKRNLTLADQLVPWFHVVSWTVPGCLVSVAAALGQLGYDPEFSSGWCWLGPYSTTGERLLWHLLEGKGLEIISLIVTPLLYILIMCESRRASSIHQALISSEARSAAQETDRKLAFVALIFVLLRIWGTTRFLINVDQSTPSDYYVLEVLQNFGDSAQGFANAVLYVAFTKRVRDHYIDLLHCKLFVTAGRQYFP